MIKPLKGWKKVEDTTSKHGERRKRVYATHEDRWTGVQIDIREDYYSKMSPNMTDTIFVGVSGLTIGVQGKEFKSKTQAEKRVTNIMKYVNTGRELNVLDF